MSDKAEDIFKSLFNFSLGPIVTSFIGFISVPLITYFIAPAEFGKVAMFTLAYSMINVFVFLGLEVGFVREFNAYKDKSKLFCNSIFLPLFLSLIISVLISFYWQKISILLFSIENKTAVNLLSLLIPLNVAYKFNLLYIRMQEKGKLYSVLLIVERILKIIFTILFFIFYRRNFISVVLGTVLSTLIISIISSYFSRSAWSGKKSLDLKVFYSMLIFGLPFIPTHILEWILNSIDKVALRKWCDFREIGLYAAGFKIAGVLLVFRNAFMTFWTPTLYRWYENKVDNEKYVIVNNVLTSVTILFGALLIFSRKIIIQIIAKDYYTAYTLIPFFAFIPIFSIIRQTTVCGINLSKKTYFHILIAGISSIINIIGNILLVPKYGALGASISTGFSFMVMFWTGLFISRYLWFKFPIEIFIINNILLLFLVCVVFLEWGYPIEIGIILLVILYNMKNYKYLFSKISTFALNIKQSKINGKNKSTLSGNSR